MQVPFPTHLKLPIPPLTHRTGTPKKKFPHIQPHTPLKKSSKQAHE